MRFGYKEYDSTSYQIGALVCFAEMVAAGVKRIALSGAIMKDRKDATEAIIKKIAAEYGIKYYAEYNLIKNLIAPDEYVQDKYVFMLYRDDAAIEEYKTLKALEKELLEKGEYDAEAKKRITRTLCRLLSYPEAYIEDKYGKE